MKIRLLREVQLGGQVIVPAVHPVLFVDDDMGARLVEAGAAASLEPAPEPPPAPKPAPKPKRRKSPARKSKDQSPAG